MGSRCAPPLEFCPKHPGGTEDPCRACQRYREQYSQWAADDAALAAAEQRAQHQGERDAKRQAIAACRLCDQDGYNGLSVCDHVDHSATARAGLARARAALENPPAAEAFAAFAAGAAR